MQTEEGRKTHASPGAVADVVAPSSGELVPPVSPLRPMLQINRRRRRWPWVVLLAVILLAAAGGAGVLMRPVAVTTVQATIGPAIEAIYATGTIEAIDTARAGSTVAARIDRLLVDEGARVTRGQPLALLDERQAQQRVSDAQAHLETTVTQLARDRSLAERGVRSMEALQRSIEDHDRAAAMVELAQRQLDDYRILSPLDGIVTHRNVNAGETIAASSEIFTVAATDRLRVAAEVDERDIAGVRMSAAVAVRAEAFPDDPVRAKVTNIRQQGDTATRTFRVEADLPLGSKLMIGMTVDVNVIMAERTGALLLPAAAVLHDRPQGGRPGSSYVFRVTDGVVRKTRVVTGATGADRIEIREGITATDAVTVSPPASLRDGLRVRIVP